MCTPLALLSSPPRQLSTFFLTELCLFPGIIAYWVVLFSVDHALLSFCVWLCAQNIATSFFSVFKLVIYYNNDCHINVCLISQLSLFSPSRISTTTTTTTGIPSIGTIPSPVITWKRMLTQQIMSNIFQRIPYGRLSTGFKTFAQPICRSITEPSFAPMFRLGNATSLLACCWNVNLV